MSEIKFKSYDELEVAEAMSDASHVLVEENGEVKRFPANGLGSGGGGSHWIMHLTNNYYSSDIAVSDGLYEALEKMFTDNIPVPITIFEPVNDGSIRISNAIKNYNKLDDGTGFELGNGSSDAKYWYIRKDGNHNYYYNF